MFWQMERSAIHVFEFTMLFAVQEYGSASNVVDIYNARSGVWTTAILSVPRRFLAATSLPNDGLAIFGGGDTSALCDNYVDIIVAGLFAWVCWGYDKRGSRGDAC